MLRKLPGEKQNSQLGFLRESLLVNIIAAGPPHISGPKTTHLSTPDPHKLPFPFSPPRSCGCNLSFNYLSSFPRIVLILSLFGSLLSYMLPPVALTLEGAKGSPSLITHLSLTCRVPDCLNPIHNFPLWQIYERCGPDRKPCNH